MMKRVAIDLGFIQIYWYSIFILVGILVAALIIYRECKKQGIKKEEFTDLLFNTVICGIIGARIYYVLFNLSYYMNNKIEILEIWHGGLAIHGGLLFGALYVLYFCKKHKLNKLKVIDMIVVGVIIGQAIGRWGNFFNQEAYGPLTSYATLKQNLIPDFIIKGMKILGQYYEPTFYYESLWNINGFIILLLARHSKKVRVGQITGIYLAWYSIGRIYIESLRMDSLMIKNFKVAQIVSIILIIVGVILIFRPLKKKTFGLYNDKTTTRTEDYEEDMISN
jgi:phosphatidylglycerol:prolipoprotein diacylglycerol transferase